jgi:ubiquinone biosynthesis protein COQ9
MDNNNKIISIYPKDTLYEIEIMKPAIYSSILYMSFPQDIINIILSYTDNYNQEEREKMKIISDFNYKTEENIINEINNSIYERIKKEKNIDDITKKIKAFYLSSFTKKEIIYDSNVCGYESSDTIWDDENNNDEEWFE